MKTEKVDWDSDDPYRNLPLRLLGYVGNVGDVLTEVIGPTATHATYLASLVYFLADGYDKSVKPLMDGGDATRAIVKAGDVFLWHLLASVAIPRFTRQKVSWLTHELIKNSNMKSDLQARLPMAMGLLSFAIILKPVDRFVDYLMDKTYRKVLD